jgi:hypothetical protein
VPAQVVHNTRNFISVFHTLFSPPGPLFLNMEISVPGNLFLTSRHSNFSVWAKSGKRKSFKIEVISYVTIRGKVRTPRFRNRFSDYIFPFRNSFPSFGFTLQKVLFQNCTDDRAFCGIKIIFCRIVKLTLEVENNM